MIYSTIRIIERGFCLIFHSEAATKMFEKLSKVYSYCDANNMSLCPAHI